MQRPGWKKYFGNLKDKNQRRVEKKTGLHHLQSIEILKEEVPPVLEELKTMHNATIPEIEKELDRMGAPWTPGRIPEWNID
jgi:hypothetical protein